MTLFRWGEITTTAWVFSLVISAGIVLMALPYSKEIIAIFRAIWILYTNEWTDGFQKGACECMSTLSKRLKVNSFKLRNPAIQLLSTVNRLTTYEPLITTGENEMVGTFILYLIVICLLVMVYLLWEIRMGITKQILGLQHMTTQLGEIVRIQKTLEPIDQV